MTSPPHRRIYKHMHCTWIAPDPRVYHRSKPSQPKPQIRHVFCYCEAPLYCFVCLSFFLHHTSAASACNACAPHTHQVRRDDLSVAS